MLLLRCTLVGEMSSRTWGILYSQAGGWMDRWSRGCLASVVFIFTPSLTNGISALPLPAPSPARKGIEGERAAKEKVKKVEKVE